MLWESMRQTLAGRVPSGRRRRPHRLHRSRLPLRTRSRASPTIRRPPNASVSPRPGRPKSRSTSEPSEGLPASSTAAPATATTPAPLPPSKPAPPWRGPTPQHARRAGRPAAAECGVGPPDAVTHFAPAPLAHPSLRKFAPVDHTEQLHAELCQLHRTHLDGRDAVAAGGYAWIADRRARCRLRLPALRGDLLPAAADARQSFADSPVCVNLPQLVHAEPICQDMPRP